MACKRSKQCDNADICRFAKSTDYNRLGGSCFTPKDPQTNEEWLRQANTEQLAVFLLEFRFDNNVHNPLCNYLKRNFNGTQKLEMLVVEWLKQPHSEKE